MDVEEEEEEEFTMPPPTARGPFVVPSRPLGKFMTPQVARQADFGLSRKKSLGHVRYSVGGFTPGGIYGTATPGPAGMGTASGPRRVRVVEPWRVDEITVPLNDADEHDQEYVERSEPPVVPSTPQRGTPMSPSKRERLTEGERKVGLLPSRSIETNTHSHIHRPLSRDVSQPSQSPTYSAERHPAAVFPCSHYSRQ